MKSGTQPGNIHDLDSLSNIITKAVYSHQTWSSFFGSFASSFGMICLQHIINYFMSNAEALQREENARRNMNEALTEGSELLARTYQFRDAHEVYLNAKMEFKKYFLRYLKKNAFYQNSYTNIIYGLAQSKLYLGDYESALAEVNAYLDNFSDITYRMHDMQGLRGVILMKQGKHELACHAFNESQTSYPNQQIITQLQLKCFLQGADISLTHGSMTHDKAKKYLISSMLFQTTHICPYSFEINIAHIEALLEEKIFAEALKKLEALEKQSSTIILATSDQKRLYALFIRLFTENEASKKSKTKSDNSECQFNNPLVQNSILSKEDNWKPIKELYEIKLEALGTSTTNINLSATNKRNFNADDYNRNRFFFTTVAIAVCGISYHISHGPGKPK